MEGEKEGRGGEGRGGRGEGRGGEGRGGRERKRVGKGKERRREGRGGEGRGREGGELEAPEIHINTLRSISTSDTVEHFGQSRKKMMLFTLQ